jgi:hypothetical protein
VIGKTLGYFSEAVIQFGSILSCYFKVEWKCLVSIMVRAVE